jgi:dipeptidyl-peptidase 4
MGAVHSYSTFDTPPVTDLIRFPDHQSQRMLEDDAKLHAISKDIVFGPTEFFRVDVGEGVSLDGWLIKPKDFDPAKKYPLLNLCLRRARRADCDGPMGSVEWDISSGTRK